jgi:hypothetical protein
MESFTYKARKFNLILFLPATQQAKDTPIAGWSQSPQTGPCNCCSLHFDWTFDAQRLGRK